MLWGSNYYCEVQKEKQQYGTFNYMEKKKKYITMDKLN